MTILFDATRPVKVSRSRRFGAGLFAYVPHTRVDHTAEDERLYSEMLADIEQAKRDFNEHLEERYQHSRQLDRVSRAPMF